MVDVLTNGRPAGDVLSRVVRIKLSGLEYALPVRSIRFNREWKASLDANTAAVVDELTKAGDDLELVLAQLAQDVEPFIDLLVSYAPDVLTRELIEDLEPDPSMDVINACREVWLAASPLVAIGIEALTAMVGRTATGGSLPTSSPPPSTAGPTTTSSTGSPTSSSSPTSTPEPTGSSSGAPPTSTRRSSPSEPAPSTPRTSKRSSDGAAPRVARRSVANSRSPAQPSRPR